MVGQTEAVTLKVEEQGRGFPILCLHGHPGSGQSLSVFTRHLSQRFWTLAPDLRGYGASQTRQPFTMADHLTDLEALLDQRQISRCLILGWSLGGILAMELALRQPERFGGLILVATSARPQGKHPPITWQDNFYTGLAALLNLLAPGWQWNIDQFGKRSLFRYLVQQHTPETYRHLAASAVPAYLKTSRAATQALNRALSSRYDRLEAIRQINCPCLVLAGAEDYHITAASSLLTAAQLAHSQSHCYPNTAHLFPWEIPQQVLADIDDWIQTHAAGMGLFD